MEWSLIRSQKRFTLNWINLQIEMYVRRQIKSILVGHKKGKTNKNKFGWQFQSITYILGSLQIEHYDKLELQNFKIQQQKQHKLVKMIRLPLPENEDETKRRITDVRSTFILFGVMVIIIRLSE